MKTNLSFCMLRLACLLLSCTAAATLPTALHGAITREITVGTRWPQLIATNGKVFRNVKFTYVSPREVRFMHTDGIGSLPLGEVVMPNDATLPVLGAADAGLPPELTMGPLGSMMTAQERKISGIDKLSNDEQATLAKWVQGTVEERLKEELQSRGLPPTFAPLALVPSLESAAPAAGGMAQTSAAAPALSAALGAEATAGGTARANATPDTSAALPGVGTTQLMAGAPGRTYVPPASPSLLPPPPSAASPAQAAPGPLTSPPLPGTLASAGGRQVKTKAYSGVVESSIAGEFRGLETGRQFRLVNGQTWQQQEPFAQDHLAYKPRVTIYPAHSGDGWMMAVDGLDKAVRVAPMN